MENFVLSLNPADEAVLAAVSESGVAPQVHSRSFRVMGSHASVTVVGGHPVLIDDAVGMAMELEGLWTRFSRDSDVSALNWAGGEPVEVDPRTALMVDTMQRAWRETNGVYDPTLLPHLLKGGYTHSLVDPTRSTELPDSVVAPGDVAGIVVDGSTVTLPPGTTLDSGGIGKGLAADLIVDFLRTNGALGAMVELGGDLRVDGYSPRGRGWRVGVENPLATGSHVSVVEIDSGGLATSSQLKRRFVDDGGQDTHHLIDSQTGSSVESSVLAVTVIAPTAWQAEVMAKVGFARTPAEFLHSTKRLGLRAGVFQEDGSWVRSSDWPEYRA